MANYVSRSLDQARDKSTLLTINRSDLLPTISLNRPSPVRNASIRSHLGHPMNHLPILN